MHSKESPYPALDWLAISIRWVVLFGALFVLASSSLFSIGINICIAAVALWNVSLMLMNALGRRGRFYNLLSLVGDVVGAGLLLLISGADQSPIPWVGGLPVIVGAIYYGNRGAVLVSLVFLVVQAGMALWGGPALSTLVVAGVYAGSYLLLGVIFAQIAGRSKKPIDQARRLQLSGMREMERAEGERQRAVYRLIVSMSSTLNYQRVLDRAVELSDNALAASEQQERKLISCVLLHAYKEVGGTELRVGAARRFMNQDLRLTLPGTDGLIGRAIDQGEPVLQIGLSKDPELSRIIALRTCQAAYCFPLRSGLDTYGVLLFAHPEDDFFTLNRREVLDIVGNQAVVAMQNARLYQDLRQEKERMMEIQEEARKKLARNLHDGPTQSVAAIAMRVNFARRLIDRDMKAAAEEMFKIEELARQTTKEIRHMLFTLRPLVLESRGLIAALESMAEKMRETFNQNVAVSADPEVVSMLDMARQGVIFYIAEEAVNNARKHAQAAHIWVRLIFSDRDVALLEVQDDGVGFEPGSLDSQYETRGSLGMINLRERTELVNGFLQIASEPGKGTRIAVLLPLTDEAGERIRREL